MSRSRLQPGAPISISCLARVDSTGAASRKLLRSGNMQGSRHTQGLEVRLTTEQDAVIDPIRVRIKSAFALGTRVARAPASRRRIPAMPPPMDWPTNQLPRGALQAHRHPKHANCPNKAVLRRQLHEQQRYLPALKSSSPRLFSARELIPELCLPYLNRALSSQTQRDDARGARTLN